MKNTNTALMMMSDKTGIEVPARALIALGTTIYGSEGTVDHLAKLGVPAINIAKFVGNPIFGKRVISISREMAAATLAREVEEDLKELQRLGLPCFDSVWVDFYPLEKEIRREGSTRESVIKETDIGGPHAIRMGAKGDCLVVCRRKDWENAIEWLRTGRRGDGLFVEMQAARGEFEVSKYCLASANYRSGGEFKGFFGKRIAVCKYGENQWQSPAELFSFETDDSLALDKFGVIAGTPPSYNNWVDLDRMLQTITHIAAGFATNYGKVPFIAIGAKHGNACGVAVGDNQQEILKGMVNGDPISIFGGLVMTNFAINETNAEVLAGHLFDGIIAPAITNEAIEILKRKHDKCRFIVNPALEGIDEKSLDTGLRFRYVRGGFLTQPNYTFVLNMTHPDLAKKVNRITGNIEANIRLMEADMVLAWAIGSTSNSNTITLVKNGQLLGNAVGQQDRVGSAKLVIERALRSNHVIDGAVAYSDSFFPAPDGPTTLAEQNILGIFASSGSIKDKLTVEVCNESNTDLYMIPDALGRGFCAH